MSRRGLNPKLVSNILAHCPCGKLRAKTQAEAEVLHHKAVSKHGNNNPVRFYQCAYDNWHWTSKTELVDSQGRPWSTITEQRWAEAQGS